jgi:ABC-2 type transport system permease protein
MNKIFLIIAREYITRVRKKSFIIMSIIGPILFGLMFVIPVWLASREGENKVIEILDESGYFKDKFSNEGSVTFKYLNNSIDEAKETLSSNEYYGLLHIPKLDLEKPDNITFYAEKNPSIEIQGLIERMLRNEIEDIKLDQSGIDKVQLEKIKTPIDLNVINITEMGEKEGDVIVATITGYIASLLIYMFIFMYGIQTMRSIIEEKSSRIVEVIISSVKPFQLMMGKIIGVGAVGLTQFLIWIVLTVIIYQGVLSYYSIDAVPSAQTEMMQNPQSAEMQKQLPEVFSKIDTINFPLLLGAFLFFFIGAYFFYGALICRSWFGSR